MTRSLCLFGLVLAWVSPAFAQDPSHEPPVAGRPVGFSNIVGKYTIKVSAAPTDVRVEDAITLRIEITGAGPKEYEPNRKDLKLFFSLTWDKDFYFQELRDEHKVDRATKTWLFVYRLKPKHTKVEAIDDIKLIFYDQVAKRFVTKYAELMKLTVKPKPDTSGELEMKDVSVVPDTFYEHVEGKEVVAHLRPYFEMTDLQMNMALAAPPLLCVAAILVWWRFFPDESKQARQYQFSAARRALAELRAAPTAARGAVLRYLQERFGFDITDPTPADVFAFLKRRGFALARCKETQAFFAANDAARYTIDAPHEPARLADDALRVIQSLEADPCARA